MCARTDESDLHGKANWTMTGVSLEAFKPMALNAIALIGLGHGMDRLMMP
jgi:hypothetical protein